MKSKTFLFFIVFMISIIVSTSAKDRVVGGRVTTFNTLALKKVSILVKSTNIVIKTDSTGCFSLTCNNNDKLTFSAKGFFTEKIDLKNIPEADTVNVNLRLKKGKKNIEYATGYGYINEKRLSYAIEHFDSEPDYSSYNNILEIIEGRMSGVRVCENGISIRGVDLLNGENSALLVVDGTVVGITVFKNIPPSQVKSINVLKGAAASARYGSRGMGGVIVVKTKTKN
ncbi:MAG: TonB-dependent receptor plug domain-containing protein [Prolixibacteraceae bacterium]|nr:TonB-dependent receptor plug domain-containing protein [Prolixibacteraceae bacterium]